MLKLLLFLLALYVGYRIFIATVLFILNYWWDQEDKKYY